MLLLLFVCTLPLVNPWVRGDGVGYYAYARALLIEHDLNFEKDWRSANPTFVMDRMDEQGQIRPEHYTSTGHLNNNFTVGPAILWAPFLISVHVGVLSLDGLGAHIPADGYSQPYRLAMALATAIYGFAGLYLAFCLARKYFDERWAFLGTVGIWFGTSLPVYMYFNPSWSHAHSAFSVALFLWYWHRTRERRTLGQWALLGLSGGLMLDVYYPNVVFLLIPLMESIAGYWRAWRSPGRDWVAIRELFSANVLFALLVVLAFTPTLVARQIISGNPLAFGYTALHQWAWTSPALGSVLFSSNHGLLSWTPIVLLALLGLLPLRRLDKDLAAYLALACLVFYYLIASHLFWHGMSSFGNRFFITLTPVFVLGLTASFASLARRFERAGPASAAAGLATALFLLWNAGLMFQWGMHMIPVRGPISWREAAYNQVFVVPRRAFYTMKEYLLARQALMGNIEQQDIRQLKEPPAPETDGKK